MINIHGVITLVAGITASIVFAIVLLTVAWTHKDEKTRYSALLSMYSVATLLDSFLMICLLALGENNLDYRFLQYFIQPTIVSLETGAGAFAIFRLLHGTSQYFRTVKHTCYTFLGTVLLYPVMYGLKLQPGQEFWDVSNYLAYAQSSIGTFLTIMVYVTSFTFNIFFSIRIFQGYLHYKEILQTYFSDDLIHLRNVCLTWWAFCMAYVSLAYINIFVESHAVHYVLRFSMIILFTCMVVMFISNADMLMRIDKAFRSIIIRNVKLRSNAADSDDTAQEMTQDAIEVRAIMEQWANRIDKPFNEKGITLKTVSDDMHLPMSVVLKYVNICYGMDFRSWILALRDAAEKEL